MGDVISKKGKVTARRIITGVEIDGAAGDEVVKAALEAAAHFQGGSVSGEQGVEVREDIVTGFRYLNPQDPDRAAFVAELKALRETIAEIQKAPKAAADAEAAGEALDTAIAEAAKPQPLAKKVILNLRNTLTFITDASKALEAADKAGVLLAKALPTAVALYQIAEKLF